MSTTGPVLIAYDGSSPSEAAIDEVARLMPGAHAVLLYAREPLETVAAHLQGHPALEQVRQIDATTGDASEALAERGAARARTAGLKATAQVATIATAVASEAIVTAANALDASLIVLGSRGRHGVGSFLLGSTSTAVLHRTNRPTLVVPAQR
jgi:nucleotide-binding universal stress UspA family protein